MKQAPTWTDEWKTQISSLRSSLDIQFVLNKILRLTISEMKILMEFGTRLVFDLALTIRQTKTEKWQDLSINILGQTLITQPNFQFYLLFSVQIPIFYNKNNTAF